MRYGVFLDIDLVKIKRRNNAFLARQIKQFKLGKLTEKELELKLDLTKQLKKR